MIEIFFILIVTSFVALVISFLVGRKKGHIYEGAEVLNSDYNPDDESHSKEKLRLMNRINILLKDQKYWAMLEDSFTKDIKLELSKDLSEKELFIRWLSEIDILKSSLQEPYDYKLESKDDDSSELSSDEKKIRRTETYNDFTHLKRLIIQHLAEGIETSSRSDFSKNPKHIYRSRGYFIILEKIAGVLVQIIIDTSSIEDQIKK